MNWLWASDVLTNELATHKNRAFIDSEKLK